MWPSYSTAKKIKNKINLLVLIINHWDIKVAEETPENKYLGPLKWSLKLSVMTEYITAYYLQKTPIIGLRGVEAQCRRVLSVWMMNGCTMSGWHMRGVADGTRVSRRKTRLDREHVFPLTAKNDTQHICCHRVTCGISKCHCVLMLKKPTHSRTLVVFQISKLPTWSCDTNVPVGTFSQDAKYVVPCTFCCEIWCEMSTEWR